MTDKSDKKNISSEDQDLFRSALDNVRPIRRKDEVRQREKPKPNAHQTVRNERSVRDELLTRMPDWSLAETGEEISFLRDGYRPKILTRLRKGAYSVADDIDLHHLSQPDAKSLILDFLDHATRQGFTCVKIIHGKGLRSKKEGPVLKRLTASVLSRHPRVLAFSSAPPKDGGTGAVYVLLKARI